MNMTPEAARLLNIENVLDNMDPLTLLTKDIKAGIRTLTETEARFVVDGYYNVQQLRIDYAGKVRSAGDEPHLFLDWMLGQAERYERQMSLGLKHYVSTKPVYYRWLKHQKGIGHVLSAGLIAHIDIHQAPYAGHIWNYAGLNPGIVWEKKQKRPWNARLKVLCWKCGQSFMKVSGREGAFYGQFYREAKARENARNDAGELADQAADALKKKNYDKKTIAYKHYIDGRLPPAHIDARARRKVVKLFLAHYHHVLYELTYGEPPPKPYAIAILEHGDYIPPPHWG